MRLFAGIWRKLDTLYVKLAALLLLLAIVPLVYAALKVSGDFTGVVRENVKEEQVLTAEANANALNTLLQEKVSSFENTVDAYKAVLIGGNREEILPVLKNMKIMNPDVKSFSYSSETGQAFDDQGNAKDLSGFDNFKRIKQEKTVGISDLLKEAGSGEQIIILDIPVLDGQGQFQGLVQGILQPGNIQKDMNKNRVSETSYAYLLSSTGMYLTHPATEKIGTDFREHANEEKVKTYEEEVLAKDLGTVDYIEEDGTPKMASFAKVELTGWKVVVSAEKYDLMSGAEESRKDAILFTVICTVVVAAISLLISLFFTRIMTSMTRLMQKVADGDLTERLVIGKGHDELQQLKKNINGMLDSFSHTIARLTDAVQHTAASSEELTAIAESSSQTSETTAKAVEGMVQGATTQTEGSEQSAVAIEEMAIGIQRIAESAGIVNQKAQEMYSEVNRGEIVVDEAVSIIKDVKEGVGKSAVMMQALESKSQEINEIVDYISSIAAQTNILALNAGIEAARAGEHGRGFGVVAEEVKKLAKQTTEAASNITVILTDLQSSAADTGKAVSLGLADVEEGVRQIENVKGVFDHVSIAVQGVTSQIEEVSAATEELSASAEEVSASMDEIVAISRESLTELKGINDAAEEQHQAMEEISSSAQSLSRMAMELQEMIAKFRI